MQQGNLQALVTYFSTPKLKRCPLAVHNIWLFQAFFPQNPERDSSRWPRS